jgi:hypothetical protein
MAGKKRKTAASDPTYDLVSTLYHALKAETFAQTAQEDARAGGDSELAAFFEHLQQVEHELAARARGLLAERMGAATRAASKAQARPGRAASAAEKHEVPPATPSEAPLEQRDRDAQGRRTADLVDEASMESFPASDSPAY